MTEPRARWRTVIASLSLLILGAAAGITIDRVLHRSPDGHTLLMEDVQEDPLGVMDRFLDLSPEQRERVAAVLASRQATLDTVWESTHIRLQATMDSVVDEIAAVLDPDQAERFRQLVDELHGTGRIRH